MVINTLQFQQIRGLSTCRKPPIVSLTRSGVYRELDNHRYVLSLIHVLLASSLPTAVTLPELKLVSFTGNRGIKKDKEEIYFKSLPLIPFVCDVYHLITKFKNVILRS